MAEADILRLTSSGKQAFLDAENKGIYLKVDSFKLGDYSGPVPEAVPTSLVGNEVHSGRIAYVEVLSAQTARFTIEIPRGVPEEAESASIGEIAVYLANGSCLGHLTYSKPRVKDSDIALRVEFMLHVTDSFAGRIDVTHSEFGSVPSVAGISDLPSPVSALQNAISVLDLHVNADGTKSPGLATRFGSGGQHWGFLGYTRLFMGNVGASNLVSPSEFTNATIVGAYGLEEGDNVIVQAVSGTGAGETRHFRVATENRFVASGDAFSDLDSSSVISIWKSLISNMSGLNFIPVPEDNADVPSDWVLQRGKEAPHWAPPFKAGKGSTGALYVAPGKLVIKPITTLTEEDKLRYDLPEVLNNNNDVFLSLQGIYQQRQAFYVDRDKLEMSEDPGAGIGLDIRSFIKEPSQGTRIVVHTKHYVADGFTREFDAGSDVAKGEDLFVLVGRMWQALSSYTVSNNQAVFTEAPPAGTAIAINSIEYVEDVGYSTKVITAQYTTNDYVNYISLPVEPQSKEQVLISENGLGIHNDQYSLVGNKIVFAGDIAPGATLEAMIFQNERALGTPDSNIVGMVTDAVVTSKSIQLLRHGALPIDLPIPEFSLQGSAGIRVTGQYPFFKIENTLAQTLAADKIATYNRVGRQKNTEELVITQKIQFNGNVQIKVDCDFSAKLGPGFASNEGLEEMQYVVGFKTTSANEPEYARAIKGTDEAGFTVASTTHSSVIAYSNASIGQSFSIVAANHPSKTIEIVAKVRVVKANIASYGSELRANLNIMVLPEL